MYVLSVDCHTDVQLYIIILHVEVSTSTGCGIHVLMFRGLLKTYFYGIWDNTTCTQRNMLAPFPCICVDVLTEKSNTTKISILVCTYKGVVPYPVDLLVVHYCTLTYYALSFFIYVFCVMYSTLLNFVRIRKGVYDTDGERHEPTQCHM